MDFLNHISSVINNFSAGQVAASLAVIIEIVLRVVPSDKPLSLVTYAEKICLAAAQVFNALASALDKLVPQNTKSAS